MHGKGPQYAERRQAERKQERKKERKIKKEGKKDVMKADKVKKGSWSRSQAGGKDKRAVEIPQ